MKKITYILAFFVFQFISAQQPYYDDVNLTLTGEALYDELQDKISNASSSFNYGDARDIFLFSDLDPTNSNDVLLVYGYNDSDGNPTTDRTRNKNDFGGSVGEYNREHVFARSNPVPDMGTVNNSTTGIGADPHNIRSSDQQMNNNKGSRKFQDGSGNAGTVGSGNWYPGDEWKGDVARMMMYMYTRYGDRCLPSLNGVGATEGATDMLQVYLEWNLEDPVSDYEDQRNAVLEVNYGNRNPFIDNPVLATIIWGGTPAEDRWDLLAITDFTAANAFVVYPNPSFDNTVTIATVLPIDTLSLYTIDGKQLQLEYTTSSTNITLEGIPSGFYLLQISSEGRRITKKIIVQ